MSQFIYLTTSYKASPIAIRKSRIVSFHDVANRPQVGNPSDTHTPKTSVTYERQSRHSAESSQIHIPYMLQDTTTIEVMDAFINIKREMDKD